MSPVLHKEEAPQQNPENSISHPGATCISMFVVMLFTASGKLSQPRCLSTDKWVMKTWCIYTLWNTVQLSRRKKSQSSQESGWTENICYHHGQAILQRKEMFSLVCTSQSEMHTCLYVNISKCGDCAVLRKDPGEGWCRVEGRKIWLVREATKFIYFLVSVRS